MFIVEEADLTRFDSAIHSLSGHRPQKVFASGRSNPFTLFTVPLLAAKCPAYREGPCKTVGSIVRGLKGVLCAIMSPNFDS